MCRDSNIDTKIIKLGLLESISEPSSTEILGAALKT
jgi:hypothetical protein